MNCGHIGQVGLGDMLIEAVDNCRIVVILKGILMRKLKLLPLIFCAASGVDWRRASLAIYLMVLRREATSSPFRQLRHL